MIAQIVRKDFQKPPSELPTAPEEHTHSVFFARGIIAHVISNKNTHRAHQHLKLGTRTAQALPSSAWSLHCLQPPCRPSSAQQLLMKSR